MSNEAVDLFRLHPVSHGLDDAAVREIAGSIEVVRYEPGACIHKAFEFVTDLFLVIHGRLRSSVMDAQGNVVIQRDVVPGAQFGGMAAALDEPAGIDCVAVDPSTLLKLNYRRAIELFRVHPEFRNNFLRLVAQSVKSAILRDRHSHPPLAVGFFHQSADTRGITQRLLHRLAELGETIQVLVDEPPPPSSERIRYLRVIGGEDELEPAELKRRVPEWLRTGRVVGDASAGIDPQRAVGAFEVCGRIFWCVTPENWEASLPRLNAILQRAPSWRDKVVLVWLLRNDELAPLAPALRALAHRDIKLTRGQPGPQQGPATVGGFERLVHLLRGVQIGVALGGGAARGMAHLGVLKALEQQGIVVDMIAGTSAGAMTGTVYASGMDVNYSIECFVRDLKPGRFFRMLPGGEQWYLLYKYRTRQFDPMLRKYLKDKCFEQLPVPMHAITVDLISGRTMVRESGDAVHGILESINLPVLAKPINRDGQALVDGGLIDNVPADVLASKGCNFVIAVSVTAKMEHEFARNRPETPAHQMRSASTIQTLLRSYLVQSVSINALGVEPADIVIEPDVTQFQLTEFTRTDELAAVGEQATLDAIPQIREQLHRIDAQLFPLAGG